MSFIKNIATLGFIGYVPYAPGTFASLLGLILFLTLKPPLPVQILILVIVIPTGIYITTKAEKILKEKDSRKIVIDELAGVFVAFFYLPQTIGLMFSAFLLFRFFDILKPVPINKLEKTLSNGLGIMADDILAGIYANIILRIWILIF